MEFNFIDGIVLFIIIVSTVLAWSRGFLRELFSILGWVIALVVAATFAYTMVDVVGSIPKVGDIIASCELRTGVGFVILFIVAMFVMAIITPLLSNWTDGTVLAGFDGLLGAIFGLFRGILVVLLLVIAYQNLLSKSSPYTPIEQSKSYAIFSPSSEELQEQIPDTDEAPGFLVDQFDRMTKRCSETPIETSDAIDG